MIFLFIPFVAATGFILGAVTVKAGARDEKACKEHFQPKPQQQEKPLPPQNELSH